MTLIESTAVDLLGQLSSGQTTSLEVTRAVLDRIERLDQSIGAFLCVDHEGALFQAEQIDERRRRGEPVGRLGGLPVAVKDILCVRGQP